MSGAFGDFTHATTVCPAVLWGKAVEEIKLLRKKKKRMGEAFESKLKLIDAINAAEEAQHGDAGELKNAFDKARKVLEDFLDGGVFED